MLKIACQAFVDKNVKCMQMYVIHTDTYIPAPHPQRPMRPSGKSLWCGERAPGGLVVVDVTGKGTVVLLLRGLVLLSIGGSGSSGSCCHLAPGFCAF